MTFSTGSDSDDDTGSMSFIIGPDGGIVCLLSGGGGGLQASCECDLWAQDCSEGRKCTAWANDGGEFWNATRCVDIDPEAGQVGDACTVEGSPVSGVDSCAEGLLCFNTDPEALTGTCEVYCAGSQANPSCAPQTECVIANNGALPLCLPSCDPLLQDCADGLGCYGVGVPGEGAPTVCMLEEVGLETDGGIAPAFCPLGSTAVPPDLIAACADDEPCCATWCSLEVADPCPVGMMCEPWADPNGPPGPPGPGVCIEG